MEAKRILIFYLGAEEYGVEVKNLQAIENYSSITPIANAPNFMEGLVNIRQDVYPVLDLRMKFGMPAAEVTPETKILLLHSNAETVACVVDAVIEIKDAEGEDVQPFPSMIRSEQTMYADCIVRRGDKLVVVIDAGHLFDEGEKAEVLKMSEQK